MKDKVCKNHSLGFTYFVRQLEKRKKRKEIEKQRLLRTRMKIIIRVEGTR